MCIRDSTNTAKGKSTGGFETKIDDNGNIIWAGEIDSNGKGNVYYTHIAVSQDGEVTGWKQFDKDSVFSQTGEAIYDKHLCMSGTTKDSVGKVKSTRKKKYDDRGKKAEDTNNDVTKDSTEKRGT